MIHTYDPDRLREADRRALERFGVPGEILMENAGAAVARFLHEAYPEARSIGILCGGGNNGGDGFVAARHLLTGGRTTEVFLAIPPDRLRGDGATAFQRLVPFIHRIHHTWEMEEPDLRQRLGDVDLLVDALLGTGSGGELRGEILRLVRASEGCSPLVALDLPTGVDGSTGEVRGFACKAERTLTFLAPKPGLYLAPGYRWAGEVHTLDLGVPAEALLVGPPSCRILRREDRSGLLPVLSPDMHKGRRGLVLVVGGSDRYGGAPFLSGLGALRAGAGWVVVAAPREACGTYGSLIPEAILLPGRTDRGGSLDAASLRDSLREYLPRQGCLVVGPGMGRGEGGKGLLEELLRTWKGPSVLDADALRLLPELPEELHRAPGRWITPHEGEAAFLLDRDPQWVRTHRREAAEELFRAFGPTLLKGERTLLRGEEGVFVLQGGDPCLSVSGSGDVLSGILGALGARWYPDPLRGALLGALVHGCAGEELAVSRGGEGVLAREIADRIPRLLGASGGEDHA